MSEETRTNAPRPRMGPGGFGGRQMGPGGEKAKDSQKTLRTLWTYMSPYRNRILAVLTLAVFSTVFSIVGPKLLGKVTTKMLDGIFAYLAGVNLLTDFTYMGRIIGLLIALYLISALCSLSQAFLMSRVSMDVTYTMRKQLSEKMHRLPLNYYDTRTRGEILSRITNDIDTVSLTLNQSLTQLVTSVTTILGVLCMMLSISWLMTAAALVVVPLSLGLLGIVIKRSQGFFKAQQKSLGEINGHVEEMYGGYHVVQAFNGEQDAIEKFEKINEKLFSSAWRSQFISGIMMPVMQMIGNVGYVLVSVLGGLSCRKAGFGYRRHPGVYPVHALDYAANGPAGLHLDTLQSTVAAAERVFEFLDEEEESPDEAQTAELAVRGDVDFEHVRFGYNPEQMIIKDFSAHVRAGQKVAIVGPTGAGKTTIVKLLMRFYDINGGSIKIDGMNINDLPRNQVRACFGMVLQDSWLYKATIMENIRYGTFEATDEEVIAAAKAARATNLSVRCPRLPDGAQRGADNISQGQKKLVTIAGSFWPTRNPDLDEATSSVDTRTEILIRTPWTNIIKNRTSFVIAHRLSTVKNADTILVLRDGDIIEQEATRRFWRRAGFTPSCTTASSNRKKIIFARRESARQSHRNQSAENRESHMN
jgi:ATP-binding cassette subfamily B protein